MHLQTKNQKRSYLRVKCNMILEQCCFKGLISMFLFLNSDMMELSINFLAHGTKTFFMIYLGLAYSSKPGSKLKWL